MAARRTTGCATTGGWASPSGGGPTQDQSVGRADDHSSGAGTERERAPRLRSDKLENGGEQQLRLRGTRVATADGLGDRLAALADGLQRDEVVQSARASSFQDYVARCFVSVH